MSNKNKQKIRRTKSYVSEKSDKQTIRELKSLVRKFIKENSRLKKELRRRDDMEDALQEALLELAVYDDSGVGGGLGKYLRIVLSVGNL